MIDPKKIEEWKAAAERSVGEGSAGDRLPAQWIVDLLAEREEMQAEALAEREGLIEALLRVATTLPVAASSVRLLEALAVLRDVEWNGPTPEGPGALRCPACGQRMEKGHAPDCRLAALLKG